VARRDQLVDPLAGQLDHEGAAHEHGEDLAAVPQRAAPEPAAAVRQRHAVDVAEFAEQVLEAHLRREVCRHADRVSLQL
jgi:hypothetical protein